MFVAATEIQAGDVLHRGRLSGEVVRYVVERAYVAGALVVVECAQGGERRALTLGVTEVVAVRRGDGQTDDQVDVEAMTRALLYEVGLGAVPQHVIDGVLADVLQRAQTERTRVATVSDMRGLAAREAIVVHDVEA